MARITRPHGDAAKKRRGHKDHSAKEMLKDFERQYIAKNRDPVIHL